MILTVNKRLKFYLFYKLDWTGRVSEREEEYELRKSGMTLEPFGWNSNKSRHMIHY